MAFSMLAVGLVGGMMTLLVGLLAGHALYEVFFKDGKDF